MKAFLAHVAEDLLQRWGAEGLRDSMLFFPSSRAQLFFVRHLHQQHTGAMWLPKWGSLREVMERVTGMEVVDPLVLAGYVHTWMREHGVVTAEQPEDSFEHFLPWAMTILRDFDQVDKYRVDARALFLNIQELRLVDSKADYLSEEQRELLESYFGGVFREGADLSEKYQRIWQKLSSLYDDLHRHMREIRQGYEGAVVRLGVQRLVDGDVDLVRDGYLPKRVAFVGFNALSASEQIFFSHAQHRGEDARYYWNYADYFVEVGGQSHDAELVTQEMQDTFGEKVLARLAKGGDTQELAVEVAEQFRHLEGGQRYYIQRPKEEAGLFISQNLQTYSSALLPVASESLHLQQDIHLYSSPTILSQAEVLSDILEGMRSRGEDFSRTVVVLPDENLLFPVLREIPSELAKHANITMGYPMLSTPAFDLMTDLVAVLRGDKPDADTSPELRERIMLNPLFKGWIQDIQSLVTPEEGDGILDIRLLRLSHELVGELSEVDLQGAGSRKRLLDHLLATMLEESRRAGLINALLRVLQLLAIPWTEHTPSIWRAYVHTTHGLLEDLARGLKAANLSPTPGLVAKLLPKLFATAKLPIKGEATDGLQIMGFLETRNLDFDNVIILSCNEAYLPAQRNAPSFIFQSLQRLYGLPCRSEREAMYAYYFHMGIARASRVHLVYVQNDALDQEGAPSRYILQMRHLWNMPEGKLHEVDYSFSPTPAKIDTRDVPKEGVVRAMLERFLDIGPEGVPLSPSAIKTYVECPMRFYYSRLCRLRGREGEATGEFDPRFYGDIVHHTLEALYKPFTHAEGQEVRLLSETDFTELLEEGFSAGDSLIGRTVRAQAQILSKQEIARLKGLTPEETNALPDVSFNGLQELQLELIEEVIRNVIRTDRYSLSSHSTGGFSNGEAQLLAVLALEKQEHFDFRIPHVGTVRIQGYIDRLDLVLRADGTKALRAIDYKTGRLQQRHVSFREVEDLFRGSTPTSDPSNVLQVMLYCDMLANGEDWKEKWSAGNIYPALYHLLPGREGDGMLDQEKGLLKLPAVNEAKPREKGRGYDYCPIQRVAPYQLDFHLGLTRLLTELFDYSRPFQRVSLDFSHRCAYCDYREICRE